MSIESTLQRVTAIRQTLADPAALIGSSAAVSGGTEAPAGTGTSGAASFASVLQQAGGGESPSTVTQTPSPLGTSADLAASQASYAPASLAYQPLGSALGVYPQQGLYGLTGNPALSSGGGVGGEIVQVAESQIGQTEQPPGSNESPAIAQYRSATAGAEPGAPWCAYFASWAAGQAGAPIGESGQGLGSVSEIWSWAQGAGRAIPNGPGVVPKPGDLIVFGDQHVGIVKDVLPSGQIQTIEGNYENKVAANVRSPTEATGYVSMS